MATENVPVYNQYIGNGLATRFSIGFPYLDRDYVKVYIKRVGGVEEELTDDRYEFENDTTIVFPLSDDDELLQDGDILTIQRETELGSDFEFDNQRRLFPEEVMNADDLSFQQIQELKRELDRAVKSRATDTITGPELYDSLQQQFRDVETKVGLAASSANMAQTWAEGTDSAVAELGGEHSSKEWATRAEALVGPLTPIAPQLAELANHVEELDTVAGSVDSVNTVADIAGQVVTVAAIDSDVMDVADNKDNIATVANNISGINRVAPNAQKIADANDNFEQLLKQINGEGDLDSIVSGNNVTQATSSVRGTARFATDAEAQAGTSTTTMITPKQLKQYSGGGGGSVDAYTKAETDEKLLLKQDKATAVNHDNITNCITEIPQDIKLELNNGTLTLKAGSKIYVPNGKNTDGNLKFDEVVIESDLTGDSEYVNDKMAIFVKADGTGLTRRAVPFCESGSSHSRTSWYNWYDTTNNKIGSYGGDGALEFYCSLPVAVVTDSTDGFTSIDQVFNGFGYIGSTVFALPNVKGLIPNGRNEDGSLKNIKFTTSKILIYTVGNFTSNMYVLLNATGISCLDTLNIEYKEKENLVYNTSQSWIEYASICCNLYRTNGKITSFTPKTPFHAVDYNDKSIISGWGMPSRRYITLTLGASGSSYTAPANGWFFIRRTSTAENQSLQITGNDAVQSWIYSSASSQLMAVYRPAKKGEIVAISYTLGSDKNQIFSFVYAEGDK